MDKAEFEHKFNTVCVVGLHYQFPTAALVFEFSRHGPIKCICRPEGEQTEHWAPGTFAFVEYTSSKHAANAVKDLHGQILDGRTLAVEFTTRIINIETRGVYTDEEMFELCEQNKVLRGSVPMNELVDEVQPARPVAG